MCLRDRETKRERTKERAKAYMHIRSVRVYTLSSPGARVCVLERERKRERKREKERKSIHVYTQCKCIYAAYMYIPSVHVSTQCTCVYAVYMYILNRHLAFLCESVSDSDKERD